MTQLMGSRFEAFRKTDKRIDAIRGPGYPKIGAEIDLEILHRLVKNSCSRITIPPDGSSLPEERDNLKIG